MLYDLFILAYLIWSVGLGMASPRTPCIVQSIAITMLTITEVVSRILDKKQM
jgi:hypothetical protein